MTPQHALLTFGDAAYHIIIEVFKDCIPCGDLAMLFESLAASVAHYGVPIGLIAFAVCPCYSLPH